MRSAYGANCTARRTATFKGDDREYSRLGQTHVEIATATVDANYFATMGIPLLRGREPHADERNVTVVNAALADRLWPGHDPVGRSLRLEKDRVALQVIGVTATGKYWSLSESARPFVYQISDRPATPLLCLAIRTQGPPADLALGIADEIHRLDPKLQSIRVQTETERLREWLEPGRAAAMLLGILGLAALSLAITGLYALLTQWVAQRTPEIAVRMALGASRTAVIGLLLGQTAILICSGAAAGLTASAAVAQLLGSLSGQGNPLDAVTVIGVATLLATVGAAATFVPASKAANIDPVSTLRTE